MHLPLDVSGSTFAEISVAGFHGEAGIGFHRFDIDLMLIPTQTTANVRMIDNFRGEILFTPPGATNPLPLAPLRPRPHAPNRHKWRGLGNRHHVYLAADVERQRLDTLERMRNGGEIAFILRFGMDVYEGGSPEEVALDLRHQVNRSDWLEVLKAVRYAEFVLLEVPVPNPQTDPSLARATEHLQAAQQALLRGEYRESVGQCRDVLEAVSTALREGDTLPAGTESLFANSRALGKEERVRVLRRATKLLTHPARHADEVSARIEWTRDDALLTLRVVAALLGASP